MSEPVFTRQNPIELECPICGRVWTPSLFDDYMLPACGCYGATPTRDTPCEGCGISHAWNCPKIPGREERVAKTTTPKLYEVWEDGTEVVRGTVDDVS